MTAALRVSFLCLARRAPLYLIYKALGIVALISVGFACLQSLGYYFWPTYLNYPTGLFYSPIAQGGFLGLMITCLARHWWWPIPILAFGLYLNPNRGGWIVAGIGLLALWTRRPLVILLVILTAVFILTGYFSQSDAWRLAIWYSAITHLSWFGNGIGSFDDIWLIKDNLYYHPIHAHNDYIQLVYELGLYSIPVFCVLVYALLQTQSTEWPVLVAFCTMATFAMPSYIPATASIGALALASILIKGANNG